MLQIENLSVIRSGRAILDAVSLNVAAGELVLIAGHNGAGKSTLLKTIFGETKPSTGRLTSVSASSIFYLPQGNTVFPSLTVDEHLRLYRALGPAPKAEEPWADSRLPGQTIAGNLSGGEAQWLAALRLNTMKPKVTLVDELTTGLSPSWCGRLLEALRRMTDDTAAPTLLVEHNIREALRIADRLVILSQGKVVLDAPAACFRHDQAALEKALLL